MFKIDAGSNLLQIVDTRSVEDTLFYTLKFCVKGVKASNFMSWMLGDVQCSTWFLERGVNGAGDRTYWVC